MALTEGSKAPDFKLESTNGDTFCLYDSQIGKPCILYFYPKDFTPGCEKEACDFRDNFNLITDLGVTIFGISTDSIETHLKFKERFNLPFHLLSDPDGSVSKSYKAIIPFLKISKRVTYYLDSELIIRGVYENFFGAHLHLKQIMGKINQ